MKSKKSITTVAALSVAALFLSGCSRSTDVVETLYGHKILAHGSPSYGYISITGVPGRYTTLLEAEQAIQVQEMQRRDLP